MLSEAECYVVSVYFAGVATRLKLIDRTEKKDLRTKQIRTRSTRRALEAD